MQLNGAGSGSLTLVNAVRHVILRNIGFISGIVDDHCTVFVGIVHPYLQLVFGDGSSGGVVGAAQVNDIRCFFWKFRYKVVFCGAGHVDHIAPGAFCRIISAGTSCHNISVHVYRINRVAHCNFVVYTENLLNVSGITLCSV